MNDLFTKPKATFIQDSIEEANPVTVTDTVHAFVWGTVKHLVYQKGRLHYVSAPTGTGKTTGFIKAIERVWASMWSQLPVLVLVPTKHDAELLYRAMEQVEEGCCGVWTESHDPDRKVPDAHFEPTRLFTKAEASTYKCLILTHNAGKKAEAWVGRRDLVFVDEDPQPTDTETFELWQFTKAMDDEAKVGPYGSIYQEADAWARSQVEQGLSTVVIPSWVDQVLAISPVTSEGQGIQRLAQAFKDGRAFQSRTSATSWVVFKYDLPFQDRTIIFSATAMYEGYQFGNNSEFLDNLLPKIDYSFVTFKLKEWPEGLTRNHKNIITNRTNRERFFEEIKQWITWASETTLIICPKDFRSDIEGMFPDAKVTNYGRDVGSNEYRDCTDVYVVSEFFKPVDALRANYLGHTGVEVVTEDSLKPLQNSQGSLMRELKDANYSVHLMQMISRSALRKISPDGKAGEVTVHCMIGEDRFTRLLPKLFPKCQLVYPEGRQTHKTTGRGDNTMIVNKAIRYLSQVPKDQEFVGSPELMENGIWVQGKAKVKQVAKGEAQFMSIGWFFRKGSGKGDPSGFQRF